MPRLLERLREWWRVHYMERGFGVLVPGFQRHVERDLRSMQFRHREISETDPSGWSVAVYRGNVYADSTEAELRGVLLRLYERDGVPRAYRMAPRPVAGRERRRA